MLEVRGTPTGDLCPSFLLISTIDDIIPVAGNDQDHRRPAVVCPPAAFAV